MRHAVDPELEMPPPRPVRRRRGHGTLITFVHVFILPHTLVGLGMIAFWLVLAAQVALGHDVQGRVTAIEPYYSKGQHWTVRYVADGLAGSSSVSTQPTYRVGDSITLNEVAYGPLQRLEISGESNLGVLGIVLCFVAFWNGIMLFAHYQLTIRPVIWKGLVRSGMATQGVVVGAREFGSRGRRYYVTYEFSPDFGHPRRAEMMVRREDFARAEPGTPVTVLFDPRRPRRSVVYAFAPYEVPTSS